MDLTSLKGLLDKTRRQVIKVRNNSKRDTRGSLNTGHDLRGRFCAHPFQQIDIYDKGNVHSCCSGWLPKSIGNINTTAFNDVWNSSVSQAIRESIFDGSFRYCDHKVCPLIQSGTLLTLEEAKRDAVLREVIEGRQVVVKELPVFINLCNDESCNLSCPSCRASRINHAKGKQYEKMQKLQDVITQQLFSSPATRHFTVNVTGSGDPFASTVFRDFLFNLRGEDFPNMKVQLQTNGVLLTPKNWRRMEKIHKNIESILISFDAGTEQTYNITRRGGNWKMLLENVERLGELRDKNELKYFRLDFVVQQANYHEMEKFILIGKKVHADHVTFSMILDWGTWPLKVYQQQCVWSQEHPEFDEFIRQLDNPIFDDPMVSLGNLSEYRELAKQRAMSTLSSPQV